MKQLGRPLTRVYRFVVCPAFLVVRAFPPAGFPNVIVVPDVAGGLTEDKVQGKAFELVFAFDEVITTGGHKESITLQQASENTQGRRVLFLGGHAPIRLPRRGGGGHMISRKSTAIQPITRKCNKRTQLILYLSDEACVGEEGRVYSAQCSVAMLCRICAVHGGRRSHVAGCW